MTGWHQLPKEAQDFIMLHNRAGKLEAQYPEGVPVTEKRTLGIVYSCGALWMDDDVHRVCKAETPCLRCQEVTAQHKAEQTAAAREWVKGRTPTPTDRWYYDNRGIKRNVPDEPDGDYCTGCGMITCAGEYPPWTACAIFLRCHDPDMTRANLYAVVEWDRNA